MKLFDKILSLIRFEAGTDDIPLRMATRQPFARANFWIELVQVALRMRDPRYALSLIPPYVSRGHGKAKGFIKSWFTPSNRAVSSKYQPHQGKHECARRQSQIYLVQGVAYG